MTRRTVRSDLIIVLPAVLDQHPGLKERREDSHVEKIGSFLPIERFNIVILSRSERTSASLSFPTSCSALNSFFFILT